MIWMAGLTNRGKARFLEAVLRQEWNGGSLPTNFYLLLATIDDIPDADTNVVSELTEIVAGNGYSAGGIQLIPGATDFITLIEDDTLDQGRITIKDLALVASGGNIPPSGLGASFYILTDDSSPPSDRDVIAYWSTSSPIYVSSGQTHTISTMAIVAKES